MELYTAIVLASGDGTRFGDKPKQFAMFLDKPLLLHSIDVFLSDENCGKIILALSEKLLPIWKDIVAKNSKYSVVHITIGGDTRFMSVKNSIALDINTEYVAVHDAARPIITKSWLKDVFTHAVKNKSAVPVVDLVYSIRAVKNNTSEAVNRSDYKIVQTPQFFQTSVLKKAYQQPYTEKFTDDASVVESAGYSVSLCEGLNRNIKITYPYDIEIAEAISNYQ